VVDAKGYLRLVVAIGYQLPHDPNGPPSVVLDGALVGT
jgi:hypothetical protein